jgi:hypothetical protein
MDEKQTLVEYLTSFAGESDTHPEVRRFIEDLMIKIEFGHFEEDEPKEDTDWDNA